MPGPLWRVLLQPVALLKTNLQVYGGDGLDRVRQLVHRGGLLALWSGAGATTAAAFAGHLPYHWTRGSLAEAFPEPGGASREVAVLRAAAIGVVAALVADVASNLFRVLGTHKQAAGGLSASYWSIARVLVRERGVFGFAGSGLGTKTLASVLNSILFNVLLRLWR